jgi:hypothetical protein
MSKKQYSLLVIMAVVAGLAGGVVSSQFVSGQTVFAEKETKPQKVVEAEELRLVDKKGEIHATFKVNNETGTAELRLVDSKDGGSLSLMPGLVWLQNRENTIRRYISIGSGFHQIKEGYGIVELGVDGLRLFDRSGTGSEVWLNKEGSLHLTGQAPMLNVQRSGTKSGIEATFLGYKPTLSLYENDVRRAVVGTIELRFEPTGEMRRRPVSSLVLFGADGKVIWKAP